MWPHVISPRKHTIIKNINGCPDIPFLPGVSHSFHIKMWPHVISPRKHTIIKNINGCPDIPFLPGVSHSFQVRSKNPTAIPNL
jgi:hypothetical protein